MEGPQAPIQLRHCASSTTSLYDGGTLQLPFVRGAIAIFLQNIRRGRICGMVGVALMVVATVFLLYAAVPSHNRFCKVTYVWATGGMLLALGVAFLMVSRIVVCGLMLRGPMEAWCETAPQKCPGVRMQFREKAALMELTSSAIYRTSSPKKTTANVDTTLNANTVIHTMTGSRRSRKEYLFGFEIHCCEETESYSIEDAPIDDERKQEIRAEQFYV